MISDETSTGKMQCEMGDLMSALVNSDGLHPTLTQYC